MKKRFFFLLLAAAAACALAAPVSADVIWEPNDSFYERHRDQCSYVGRLYETAGYEGNVSVWSAPNGHTVQTVENGLEVNIQFIWKDGPVQWGYLSYGQTEGWVPMGDMSKSYDSQLFLEEHSARLEVLAGPVPVDFTEAVCYRYPGGPVEGKLTEEKEYQPFSETFTQIYTDGNGLRWGYVGYYMGQRDLWVCLDDPSNEHLDTAVTPAGPSAAQLQGSSTVNGGSGSAALAIAAVLVAAVVAVTLVLIRRLAPRRRSVG